MDVLSLRLDRNSPSNEGSGLDGVDVEHLAQRCMDRLRTASGWRSVAGRLEDVQATSRRNRVQSGAQYFSTRSALIVTVDGVVVMPY